MQDSYFKNRTGDSQLKELTNSNFEDIRDVYLVSPVSDLLHFIVKQYFSAKRSVLRQNI